MKIHAIVVAGGSGTRMESDIPKQFMILDSKPILQHTLENIASFADNIDITLALPSEHIAYWQDMAEEYGCTIRHNIIAGGDTRFASVKNALAQVIDNCIIAIHDGVRPLLSKPTWQNCISAANEHGAAIPCVELNDSLRHIASTGNTNTAVERSQYRLVQTPQCFDSKIIQSAYKQKYIANFTDDASVVESIGIKVQLVNGNRENIKITTPLDIILAEAILHEHAIAQTD